MPDYKVMYYHLAGRMATAVNALEATTNALVDITEKLSWHIRPPRKCSFPALTTMRILWIMNPFQSKKCRSYIL